MAYIKPSTNRLIARIVPTTMGDSDAELTACLDQCTPDSPGAPATYMTCASACDAANPNTFAAATANTTGSTQNARDVNATIAAQKKAAGTIIPGVSDTALLVGAGVVAAVFLFKKKRRS